MTRGKRAWMPCAVVAAVAMVGPTPGLAWDFQQGYINETDQTAFDLTKVLEGEIVVTDVIHDAFSQHEVIYYDGNTIIHLSGGTVEPGEFTWACFNAPDADSVNVLSVFWTDEDGFKIADALGVGSGADVEDDGGIFTVTVTVQVFWHEWDGMGYPPVFPDGPGATLGPVNGFEVFYAITDVLRSLEALNEQLYDDPSLEWIPLEPFVLGFGETREYPLGVQPEGSVVLFRYMAEGMPPCDGDANSDGVVDPLDSGYVLARFGCPVGTGDPTCDAADQNGDGVVDPLDVGYVLARFGPCGVPLHASEILQLSVGGAGSCDMVNAGGCIPTSNTLQVGITGGFTHHCEGPVDQWTSLAYPIYGLNAGDVIDAINITHNSNNGIGTLYLMGDIGCPDVTNIIWTGDSVIQGNGTGVNTRYPIADAIGNPVTAPGGTLWVVAAPHSSFAFDIAFDCTDDGPPGQVFGNLGGDATDCGTWLDLSAFQHGDPCNPNGTFAGCPLVAVEVGTACEPDDPILDFCEPLAPICGPGAGDCCIDNGTPGCDDIPCCETVCGIDPFCCDTAWDSICADEAVDFCGDLCVPFGQGSSMSMPGLATEAER